MRMKKRRYTFLLGLFFTVVIYAAEGDNYSFILQKESDSTIVESLKDFPYKMGVLSLKDSCIDMGIIHNTETKIRTISLHNSSDKSVSVMFDRVPAFIELSERQFKIAPNKSKEIVLTYNANKKKDWGELKDRVMLIIDNSREVQNNILIKANIKEDFLKWTSEQLENAPKFYIENTHFDIGNISNKKKIKHHISIENKGKSTLIIRKIISSCSCTHASVKNKNLDIGERTYIDVVFNPKGKRGKQHKSITLITNDPKNEIVVIDIKGNIVR